MRNARRSVMTALLTAGLATIGCATLLGLPDENSDAPGQGTSSDAASDKDVSVQDTGDSATDGGGDSGKDVSTDTKDAGNKDADAGGQDANEAGLEAGQDSFDAPTADGDAEVVDADAATLDAPDTGPLAKDEVIKLAVGVYHTCVLRANGDGGTRTDCWGRAYDGQLGRGYVSDNSAGPAAVIDWNGSLDPIRTLVDIEAGENHSCGIDTNHEVYCWGGNGLGQLGLGDTNDVDRPTKVSGLSNVQMLSLGNATSMAYDSAGNLWWWGVSLLDPNPDQPTVHQNSPVKVTPGLGSLKAISNTHGHACVLTDPDGQVLYWGNNDSLQCGGDPAGCSVCHKANDAATPAQPCDVLPVAVPLIQPGALEARTGYFASCALAANKVVWCWGDDGYGQLGFRNEPATTLGCGGKGKLAKQNLDTTTYSTIVMGYNHACGLKLDRTVVCWGSAGYASLGNNADNPSAVPVHVLVSLQPLDSIDFLSTKGAATCAARKSPAAVYCWGGNEGNFEWLMDGSTDNLPVATPITLPSMQ